MDCPKGYYRIVRFILHGRNAFSPSLARAAPCHIFKKRQIYGQHVIVVYQKNDFDDSSDDENVMFTSKENPGDDKTRFGVYKKGYQSRDGWYSWKNSTSQAPNGTTKLFIDGSKDSLKIVNGKRQVLGFMASPVESSGNRADQLGHATTGFKGAVAEVIGFSKAISMEEHFAYTAYLMQKWDCGEKLNNQMIPSTAALTVASGATLDLTEYTGDMALTVKSATIADGATIKIDAMPNDGVILKLTDGVAASTTGVTIDVGGTELADTYKLVTTATELKIVGPAAKIGDTEYAYVSDAINAAAEGDTIVVSQSEVLAATTKVGTYTVELAEGVTLSAAAPLVASVEGGTLTIVREAATFTYIGESGNTEDELKDVANWTTEGVVTGVLPSTADEIVFNSDVAIRINGDLGYSNIVVNANVTITGNGKSINYANISGTGKLIMGEGAYFYPRLNGEVSCDIEVLTVAESATKPQFKIVSGGGTSVFTGKLTGAGKLCFTQGNIDSVNFFL